METLKSYYNKSKYFYHSKISQKVSPIKPEAKAETKQTEQNQGNQQPTPQQQPTVTSNKQQEQQNQQVQQPKVYNQPISTDQIEIMRKLIQEEFDLTMTAEQQKFRVCLANEERRRRDNMKAQALQIEQQLKQQKQNKLVVMDKMEQEIGKQFQVVQNKEKSIMEQQKMLKEQEKQCQILYKTRLQGSQQILNKQLQQLEQQLHIEESKAEQCQSQAAFFEKELKLMDQKRTTEQNEFQKFILNQKQNPNQKIKEQIIIKQEQNEKQMQKMNQLEQEVHGIKEELEQVMMEIENEMQ